MQLIVYFSYVTIITFYSPIIANGLKEVWFLVLEHMGAHKHTQVKSVTPKYINKNTCS